MDAFDQEPTQQAPAVPVPAPATQLSVGTDAPASLPTMADLDRLAGELDRIDLTLAEHDGPIRAATN